MKRKLCKFSVILFVVLVSGQAIATGENLIRDSSFEQKLAPDQGGWIPFDQSRFSTDQARSGQQSMMNAGFSRPQPTPPYLLGGASGSYQEFPAEPGSRWRLTGYGSAPNALRGTPAFGIVQLSFFDSQGNDLGTVETADRNTPLAKTSNQVNNQAPAGEWIFLDTGIATAPEGTATVQAFTLYVDYSGSEVSQSVYFDDVTLCNVGDESDCR